MEEMMKGMQGGSPEPQKNKPKASSSDLLNLIGGTVEELASVFDPFKWVKGIFG